MKTTLYSLIAAAAACGLASAAETAYTGAVGYETLATNVGFNFVGVRLHESPIASGLLDSATATTVTDNEVDLGALIVSGSYILEIQDGSGIIQEVTSATGTALNVAADLQGLTYPLSYSLRPASTLASVFGDTAANCKLDIGAGGTGGADQLWFFNGTGYQKIYFDEFGGEFFDTAQWQDADTAEAVSSTAPLIYPDGFLIVSAAGKDVVVSGDLKAGPTELNVSPGFNFASSVGPVGLTLATAFGSTAAEVGPGGAGLNIGAGGSGGADEIWIFNGAGYDKIYFDEFGGEFFDTAQWQNSVTAALVPATTDLPSGYIISAASGGNIRSGVPAYYTGL